jgi:hypothetical protein
MPLRLPPGTLAGGVDEAEIGKRESLMREMIGSIAKLDQELEGFRLQVRAIHAALVMHGLAPRGADSPFDAILKSEDVKKTISECASEMAREMLGDVLKQASVEHMKESARREESSVDWRKMAEIERLKEEIMRRPAPSLIPDPRTMAPQSGPYKYDRTFAIPDSIKGR